MTPPTSRFWGALCFVIGTAVGAGMLAMPTTNAFSGFFCAFFLLLFSWLFMLATARLLADATLHVGEKAHLFSITETLLGKTAKSICSCVYLLLLYSLTSAYISGASSVIGGVFSHYFSLQIDETRIAILFSMALLSLLSWGMEMVDQINRFLLGLLLISYALLLFALPPHIEPHLLWHYEPRALFQGVPVMITSFGFHIIIPSLATYLKHDRKALYRAIFWGSFFVALLYLFWELLTLGTLPLQGEKSFTTALEKGGSVTQTLVALVQSPSITLGALFFSFFAILTSCLGVFLSLVDFFQDAWRDKRRSRSLLSAFLPPTLFVLLYPQSFLFALDYAAIFVAILLGIYPVLFAWNLPYPSFYHTFFGRVYLLVLFLISCSIIVISLFQQDWIFSQPSS